MKQLFFFLLFLITISAMAQTKGSGKLYGYRQGVAPGIIQKDIHEDGTQTISAPRQRANYYIYLVTPSRAYPSELWVNGEVYSASVRSIAKTPVKLTDSSVPTEPVTKVLVPKTSQMVIQLTPAPAISSKIGNKGKSLAAGNELVVVYKQNGKFYYQTLPKIADLNTAALQ